MLSYYQTFQTRLKRKQKDEVKCVLKLWMHVCGSRMNTDGTCVISVLVLADGEMKKWSLI